MESLISGATTALITPFKNGKIDEATFAKLIQRQIESGIDAVCPVGTMVRVQPKHDEHKRCIEIAVEVCRDTSTKVLAGAGSNAKHEAIGYCKNAESAGVRCNIPQVKAQLLQLRPDQEGAIST